VEGGRKEEGGMRKNIGGKLEEIAADEQRGGKSTEFGE
jgi:hypothetical protein